VIRDQQVVENGIKLDEVVHNILRAARYGIDKDDEKVRSCMAKICFTDDHDEIDEVLAVHAGHARQNLIYAINAEPLKVTIRGSTGPELGGACRAGERSGFGRDAFVRPILDSHKVYYGI